MCLRRGHRKAKASQPDQPSQTRINRPKLRQRFVERLFRVLLQVYIFFDAREPGPHRSVHPQVSSSSEQRTRPSHQTVGRNKRAGPIRFVTQLDCQHKQEHA
jgi:hypothetical protein